MDERPQGLLQICLKMANSDIQPENNENRVIVDLFKELRDEGYIKPERQLAIVENGDPYYTKPIHKEFIFFNKNYPIPEDTRILTLILLHEEGHKRYSQFQSVYIFYILLPLFACFFMGILIIFLFNLFWITINPEFSKNPFSYYGIPLYIGLFFFFWLSIKHFFSKRYLRCDEIHADIYGAIGIKKKYNEANPSLITKASFEYYDSLKGMRTLPETRIQRQFFQLKRLLKRIERIAKNPA